MERKWWTLLAVCLGTFMLLVDVTIVNVALPSIQDDLHASFAQLQWVVDAYALALAALEMRESPLSERETDVLRRFAAGTGLLAIAAELFLSYGTVRNYMASAVTKLGGRNRMDAVRIAAKAGWL